MTEFTGDQYQEKYFKGLNNPAFIEQFVKNIIERIVKKKNKMNRTPTMNRTSTMNRNKSNTGIVEKSNTGIVEKITSVRGILKSVTTYVSSVFYPKKSSIALFISSHGEEHENTIIKNILRNYLDLRSESERKSIEKFVKNSVNAVVVTPQVLAPMNDTDLNQCRISSSSADVVLVQDLYKLFNHMYPDLAIDKFISLRLFTLARLLLREQFIDLHNPQNPDDPIEPWQAKYVKLINDKNIWKERGIDANNTLDRMYLIRPGPKEGDTDCIYGINVLDLRHTDGKVATLDDNRPVLQLRGNIIGLNRILNPVEPDRYSTDPDTGSIEIQVRDTIKMSDRETETETHYTHDRFIKYIDKILPPDESNQIKRKIVFRVLQKITMSMTYEPEYKVIYLSDILVLCYCLNLQPYIFDPACRPIQNGPKTRSGTEYGLVKVPDEYFDTQDTDLFLSQSSGGTKKNKSLHKRKLSKRKTRKLYRSQKHKQP